MFKVNRNIQVKYICSFGMFHIKLKSSRVDSEKPQLPDTEHLFPPALGHSNLGLSIGCAVFLAGRRDLARGIGMNVNSTSSEPGTRWKFLSNFIPNHLNFEGKMYLAKHIRSVNQYIFSLPKYF